MPTFLALDEEWKTLMKVERKDGIARRQPRLQHKPCVSIVRTRL